MLPDKTIELLQKQSELTQQIRVLEAKVQLNRSFKNLWTYKRFYT